MKKSLICIIALVLFIMLNITCVKSEGIDYSSMSNEELLSMQKGFTDELMRRGLIKRIKLPAGQYEVGVDIPAGTYIITAAEINSEYYSTVAVFEDWSKVTEQGELATYIELLTDLGECTVKLKENNILWLAHVSYYIQKFDLSIF